MESFLEVQGGWDENWVLCSLFRAMLCHHCSWLACNPANKCRRTFKDDVAGSGAAGAPLNP